MVNNLIAGNFNEFPNILVNSYKLSIIYIDYKCQSKF